MKKCAKCNVSKPIEEYHKQAAKSDGLHPWCKVCAREHRLLNEDKERIREYRKNKNVEDKERNAARWKVYYEVNKENMTERKSKYVKENALKYANYSYRRRTLLAEAGSFTEQEWADLCTKYNNTCVYPGCKVTKLTVDHVVPLSKGGSNTIDNLQPLCKSHNSSKHSNVADYR